MPKKIKPELKELFTDEVLERINSGKWGLKHIEYLYQHQDKYGLDSTEINLYVLHVYRYTYNQAMIDGQIDPDEMSYLNQIKQLYNHNNPPKTISEVMTMKNHIHALTQGFKYNQEIKAINDIDAIPSEKNSLKRASENAYKKQLKLAAISATMYAAEKRRKAKIKKQQEEQALQIEKEKQMHEEEKEILSDKRRYLPKYPRPKLTPFTTGSFW